MSSCAVANQATGIVRRVDVDHVWVEVSSQGCGQCSGQKSCGSGLLGLHSGPREYCLRNTMGARIGDVVTLSIASGTVLRGAMLAYAMPLSLGVLGAAAATALGGNDGQAAAGLAAGVFVGWLLLRFLSGGREPVATISLKSATTPDQPGCC